MTENQSPFGESQIEQASAVAPAEVVSNKVSGKKTTIGGQALMEGLMMVGPRRIAMAVRKADGSIIVEEISQGRKTIFFEKIPLARGCIRLFRQLVTGTGALMRSAELSEEAPPKTVPSSGDDTPDITSSLEATDVSSVEDQSNKAREAAVFQDPKQQTPSKLDEFIDKHMNLMMVLTATLGLLFSVVLFLILPSLIVSFITYFIPDSNLGDFSVNLILNLVEGLLRITIFIAYLAITSRLKDIARVWMYHGAEHKTIACYEAGEPLTVENVRKYNRFHPRCGTAFMFIVIVVSILVFSVADAIIDVDIWWVDALTRLAMVPVVGGIAYEIIHFTGKHDDNAVCKAISKPGMWLQRFTTKEPDDSMLEVAITAMEAVMPEHEGEDNW